MYVPPLMCSGITIFAPMSKYCKPGMTIGIIGIGGIGHVQILNSNI